MILDARSIVKHKGGDLSSGERSIYARADGDRLSFFVVDNARLKYIRALGGDGRAQLVEAPFARKITRNFTDGSIFIPQNESFWSANKNDEHFRLMPKGATWEKFWLEPIDSIELEPIDAMLVVLDLKSLDAALEHLDLNQTRLRAVLIDGLSNEKLGALSEQKKIPAAPMTELDRFLIDGRNDLWLLTGGSLEARRSMSEDLQRRGIGRASIVDFEPNMKITPTWAANFRAAVETEIDFIATGDLRAAVGFNIDQINNVKGISLAAEGQDLRQSYWIAKKVFEHNRSIKFALIGLTPESLAVDDKYFSERGLDCRYLFSIGSDSTFDDQIFYRLLNREIKPPSTSAEPDRNQNEFKKSLDRNYSFEPQSDRNEPELRADDLRRLEDYIRLCLEHDVKPIGVILPTLDSERNVERKNLFRRVLGYLERAFDFTLIDLSELPLETDSFAKDDRLNLKGARRVSNVLNWKLHRRGVLPIEDMRLLTYDRLYALLSMVGKEEFDEMMDRVFEATIDRIKRKDKIRIGFVLFDSAMWSGDELYNQFARNDRYEPTVFFCLRSTEKTELTDENFYHGLNLLRSRGLNVVEMSDIDKKIPKQDLIFYLTPYSKYLTRAFRYVKMTGETLITYIPYGFRTTYWDISSFPINFFAWKVFADSRAFIDHFKHNLNIDESRIVFSGLPKMDAFFTQADAPFDWKKSRADAVKIVWAPHWSIKGFQQHRLSTFHWNFKFFYDYAKNHPETSWVVKPHPQLLTSAVTTGVFPSTEAFEEYLFAWNELPNAQVVIGGYYQPLFSTSDAMILDSGSFIGEYQYTHKPMLFLTREEQKFSPLGKELIDANYQVDGKNFDGIAKFIENVVINRNDTQREAREKIFDAELNYRKQNGMLASEMIFKTLDEAFKR